MWLGRVLVVFAMLFPFSIRAAFIGDYTKGRFTLGGSLGINQEDYTRSRNGSEVSRRELEKEAAVDLAGFVWDPRFLSFSSGVTVTEGDTATSGEGSNRQSLGYYLNTTWFGGRDHPLNVFANRRTNTVANADSPSYDLDTEHYGLRWGFQRKTLGNVRVGFEVLDAQSASAEVERDERREIVEFEGKRQINRENGSHSDLTYGFRGIDSEDDVLGTVSRQRNWYAYDRTDLDETTSLISNIRYYDRKDVFPDIDQGGLRQVESSFINATSSIRIQSSDVFRQHYSLALSQSGSSTSESTRYDLRGGIAYNWAPNWEFRTNAGLNGGNFQSDTDSGEDLSSLLEASLRYNRHFDILDLRAGISTAYDSEIRSSDPEGRGNTISHTATLGLSRQANPWWQDSVDYRFTNEQGERGSSEHNLHYSATSRITPSDHLRLTGDWRRYDNGQLVVAQTTDNRRYKIDWNHRLGSGNVFSLGAGRSQTASDDSKVSRSFVQGRLGLSPRWIRRLHINGLVHLEKEERAEAERTALRVEANLVYPFGRWETRAVYRYREFDDENAGFSSALDEQSIMLYLRRHFGVRF